jgi:hypothetical protein
MDETQSSSQGELDLKGSVEIVVRPELIKEKFPEVLKETDSLVETIVRLSNERASKSQKKSGGGKQQVERSIPAKGQ